MIKKIKEKKSKTCLSKTEISDIKNRSNLQQEVMIFSLSTYNPFNKDWNKITTYNYMESPGMDIFNPLERKRLKEIYIKNLYDLEIIAYDLHSEVYSIEFYPYLNKDSKFDIKKILRNYSYNINEENVDFVVYRHFVITANNWWTNDFIPFCRKNPRKKIDFYLLHVQKNGFSNKKFIT